MTAKAYDLCEDVEGHLWFDSFHPTERIHEEFAKVLWDGPSSLVGPYSLQQLFSGKEKERLIIDDYVDDPKSQEDLAVQY